MTVIGLGNPGPRYRLARHNVGFRTVDILADKLNVDLKKPFLKKYEIGKVRYKDHILFLVKPLTYMNRSGFIFPDLLRVTESAVKQLIVICDTLDLPPGVCRLKRKGSSAGHKGLSSIISRLGTGDFTRFYIGVGRPPSKEEIIHYVLAEPLVEEASLIEEALHTASDGILTLLEEEPGRVMNVLNKKKYGNN